MNNNAAIAFDFKRIPFAVFKVCLLMVLLKSARIWPLWNVHPIVFVILSLFAVVLLLLINPKLFEIKGSYLLSIFLLFLVVMYCGRGQTIVGFLTLLLSTLTISFVILLRKAQKIELLHYFTFAISIILTISIIAWILFLSGYHLPYFKTDFNDGQYHFNNHYFFLFNLNPAFLDLFPRFSSIFLEPGHLGMFTSLLLYANKFDLRKKILWPLLIATLLTFSLAAYILFMLSVSVYLAVSSRKLRLFFVVWLGIVAAAYVFFSNYNNGNNVVNQLILIRLQYENGELSGNNRTTVDMKTYYTKFLNSNDKYLGIGSEKYQKKSWKGGNAGYKVFVVQNGFVGLLFLFLFYVSLVYNDKTIFAFLFLFIYTLSFIQRAYALWEIEILLFVVALPIFSINKVIEHHVRRD